MPRETTDEDHGPLFSGTERDLYRIAFENVTALANENSNEELTAVYCENCGKPDNTLELCQTCLFFWCTRCIGSADHLEQHRMYLRHEER